MEEYFMWYGKIIDYLYKSEIDLWKAYMKIEIAIPDNLKLLLFVNTIYTQIEAPTPAMYKYFEKLVLNENNKSKELTQEFLKQQCITIEHMYGIELFDVEGYTEVYRGIHDKSNSNIAPDDVASQDLEHGISYTFDKLVAEWFAIRTQGDNCKVISAKVHKDYVICINTDRGECEIIIKPPHLGGRLLDVEFEDIQPDIKIMKQFDKRRCI